MATAPKFTDPAALQEQVDAYFEHCEATRTELPLKNGDIKIRQETPSLIGLSLWLGCSRDTITSYINGEDKSKQITDGEAYRAISGILARARERCIAALAQRATDGDCDSRTAALLLGAYGVVQRLDVQARSVVTVEGATSDDVDDWSR